MLKNGRAEKLHIESSDWSKVGLGDLGHRNRVIVSLVFVCLFHTLLLFIICLNHIALTTLLSVS